MKKTILLGICWMIFGANKAQEVNYLKYKTTITKSNMSLVKVGPLSTLEIEVAPDIITKKTTYTDPKMQKYQDYMGDKIIDLKERLAVVSIGVSKTYYLEELDSFCRISNFEATGQKKKINGYDCELYKMDSRLTTKIRPGAWIAISKSSDYTFNIWITKDIKSDQSKNLYTSCIITTNFVNIPDEGVIVKVEGTTDLGKKELAYETVLEKAETRTNVKKQYDHPWELGYTPFLPSNMISNPTLLPESGEIVGKQRVRIASRIKDLLGVEHKKAIKARDSDGFNAFYHM